MKDGNFTDPQMSNITLKTEGLDSQSEGEDNDEGKIASFCVLLHGALKVENMVALVMIGDDWFGYIYSHADCKKKSNLMLTVLPPGSDVVPWLGDLNNLGSVDFMDTGETVPSFPVRPSDKRSYSQNCVVWIRQIGLQSDIQKILRHARKLPDKTQQFYKVRIKNDVYFVRKKKDIFWKFFFKKLITLSKLNFFVLIIHILEYK